MAAVDHHDEARLLAREEILDHHARAGRAHRVADEHRVDGRVGLLARRRDDDALACGQPVRLDDDRRAALGDVRVRGVRVGERPVLRGRQAVPRHERLREVLRALELRGRLRRSEDAQARRAERVDDAGRERRLGPHDGQADLLAAREVDEVGDRGDRDVHERGIARGARVARRDEHARDARALRDLPRERMLPPAAADHEDVQGRPSAGSAGCR